MEEKKMYLGTKRDITDMLFGKGVVKFGAFKLKLHEKNPDAPLSPFFINLRTADNPKPGPLGEAELTLIAKGLVEVINEYYGIKFDAIAGIPNAGDPLVDALVKQMPEPHNFRVIKLDKIEEDGKRKIVLKPGFEYRPGEIILLVDDLITGADTKIEAVDAIRSAGCIVNDIVVLIDRQQGGVAGLTEKNVRLHSLFRIRQLFQYAKSEKLISAETYDNCIAYSVGQN